ncbi:Peptidyl-prolyl cis-trans isomerase [Balamuthia mandrillaris]
MPPKKGGGNKGGTASSGGGGGKGKGKAKGGGGGSSSDGGLKPCSHVHARHILCEKQSKILEAQRRLNGTWEEGGNTLPAMEFAQVARMMSEDKARQGGDLGWFARGQMAGPFQDIAFNLKVGEVSQPFKTKFGTCYLVVVCVCRMANICGMIGWHIVKCEGRK